MPTTLWKNRIYRLALPFMAPSVRGHLSHQTEGETFHSIREYDRILCRHHVLGGSLLVTDGSRKAAVFTDCDATIPHHADAQTIFRVASITKMAAAAVTLLLCEEGAFSLQDLAAELLPEGHRSPVLKQITLESLLCHTSGLRDLPEMDRALMEGHSFHDVLAQPGVYGSQTFRYSNFAFGLIGCVLEQATGLPLEEAFQQYLFKPLGMRATMDGSTLDEACIMPIERVLRYQPEHEVRVTPLGRIPLKEADPLRHFGHTAGAMYTDAESLSRLLEAIASKPVFRPMTQEHSDYGSVSPGMAYGLGLFILRDQQLSEGRILGHQGYAYGCVDGAFYEESTGRQVIQLNGGASECRNGRLGLINRDILRLCLRKELPSWK